MAPFSPFCNRPQGASNGETDGGGPSRLRLARLVAAVTALGIISPIDDNSDQPFNLPAPT